MIKSYRKKPVIIEATKWTGKNKEEIELFVGDYCNVSGSYVDIGTLEGLMVASVGDYIIKVIEGEFYPCKPDIFEKTYDLVSDD